MRDLIALGAACAALGCGGGASAADGGASGGTLAGMYRGTGRWSSVALPFAAAMAVEGTGGSLRLVLGADPNASFADDAGTSPFIDRCVLPMREQSPGVATYDPTRSDGLPDCPDYNCRTTSADLRVDTSGRAMLTLALNCPSGATTITVAARR
jgi:hypothetical protein